MSRQDQITECLRGAFAPMHFEIDNESHKHSVKPGSETHFKIVVVSEVFEGMPLVARQRKVNAALKDVFAAGLHALTMRTATPAEWNASPESLASPPCLGGSKARNAKDSKTVTDDPV
jgi:stress-induced morphogen